MRSVLIALVLVALPGVAGAQELPGPPVSRTEVGGHLTMSIATFIAGGPRFTFNFNRRHAIQTTADFGLGLGPDFDEWMLVYAIEYRYTLPLRLSATRVFLTAGGAGYLSWDRRRPFVIAVPQTITLPDGRVIELPQFPLYDPHRSSFEMVPPVCPIGGGGVEHRINPHVSLRGDAQLLACDAGFGFRASGGVTVALGKMR